MKVFKYIGLTAILLFSFYYTEKMSNIVINNSSLMEEINNKSKDYNIEPVSATIDDNNIIPGLNGYSVNVLKSYNNMKVLDAFNSYYLEYDVITPKISLTDNKDKIIKYGNYNKKAVSIILQNNEELINYSVNKNIKITRLISNNTFNKYVNYEQINFDYELYEKVEKLLDVNNVNKDICYINNNIIDICKDKEKFLVDSSITLNSYNISTIKNKIKSGFIIFINDDVEVSDYKILINQIYYKDLDIIPLSDLIKEERD